MKIHIIRHGLTEGNKNNEYSGWDDTPLSKEGIEELYALKETVSYPEVDVHFASDLSRAIDTHEIIFGTEKEVQLLKEMREIHFGDFEGKTVAETQGVPFFDGFLSGERVVNGETFAEFSDRINQGLDTILTYLSEHNMNEASLVCHSGVVKMIIILLESLTPKDFYRFSIANGRGIVVEFDNEINYLGYTEI